MSDQDSTTSASQTDGELDEMDEETQHDREVDKKQADGSNPGARSFSSSFLAVIRIKQKYLALKKRRQELALALEGAGTLTGAPVKSSPKIFTFDGLSPFTCPTLSSSLPQKKKRRRKRRVLFPSSGRRRAPPRQEFNRAKNCLYLLLAIVFVQVKSSEYVLKCTCFIIKVLFSS